MSRVQERRKVRLMEQAESLIDELLDWNDSTAAPNLTQIEGVVLELRKRFSEEMAREVIEAQETKQPAVAPACPKCGKGMTYKGQKRVEPQTWVGDVEIERGYYHCAGCKEGLFPPG
jgi:NMD protein affecting ribosome stability and mRNA decay